MLAKVFPANIQKAQENSDKILGFGELQSGLYVLTYKGTKGPDYLVYSSLSNQAAHFCTAVEKSHLSKGCWHLGALFWLLNKDPGEINVDPNLADPNLAIDRLVDLTPKYLGKQGDFSMLGKPNIDTSNADEEQQNQHWLAKFKIPPALIDKVEAFRERQLKRLTDEQKSRIPEIKYIPQGREVAYAVSSLLADNWEAPLFVGPKGTGKSTLAETVAGILCLPVVKIFGGIDVNAEALLGGKTLVPVEGIDVVAQYRLKAVGQRTGIDMTPYIERLKSVQMKVDFEPGPLLKAVMSGELVIVDEVNMLSPEVTSLLHGLLDWQKTLTVPGYGPVKAHPNFRAIACMNFGYSGTKTLNEAFQDRFRVIKIQYLPQNKMQSMLEGQGISPATAEKLTDVFYGLAGRVQNGDISDRCLSVRALIRAGREYGDGLGALHDLVISVLTEGLDDEYEAMQVKDMIEARLKGV